MDVVSIATTAVAALTPFVIRGGETVATEVGKKSVEAGERLLKVLFSRWRDKPASGEKLATFLQEPAKGREGITLALAAELAADPRFAAALQALLNGDPTELNVDQVAEDIENLTGAELEDMIRGKVVVKQQVRNAGTVVGVRIGKFS